MKQLSEEIDKNLDNFHNLINSEKEPWAVRTEFHNIIAVLCNNNENDNILNILYSDVDINIQVKNDLTSQK